MALRRCALALLLLGAGLAPAWPLEITAGGLRLLLHEQTGRFSLFSADKPLFVDHDPRTSYVALLLDGRVYRLGDSGEFKLQTEQTSGGARFLFTGRRFAVEQGFELRENGALELSLTVANRSDRELAAGARFLLDTKLGENQQAHFQTERPIDSESEYGAADMPSFWQSGPAVRGDGPGLRGILRGEGATAPDRLVLANWKRLNEATWLYEAGAGRSFSDLPYSINDSAVCQYYDPLPLAPGARRTIVIVLKAADAPPVEPAVQPAAVPAAVPAVQPAVQPAAVPAAEAAAVQPAAVPAPGAQTAGDLRVLNGLLQQLEQKLQSRTALSEEELRLMKQILADLKKRLEKTAR